MALVTLRVIDGADRGRIHEDLETPITIGREEGNAVQLTDERISRYHDKIQDDSDKLVLTDLESTNGSKVNGEDVQIRILRFGDIIQVGRSLLLYGTRIQIAERLTDLRNSQGDETFTKTTDEIADCIEQASLEFDWSEDTDMQSLLHTLVPPDVPEGLSPSQAAQFTELIEYIHVRLRELIATVNMKSNGQHVTLDLAQWQGVLDLQARMAEYLRSISDPDLD